VKEASETRWYTRALSVTKSAKHYIETAGCRWMALNIAEDAAVAASKRKVQRKRPVPISQKDDQYNVRHTMLLSQLKERGLDLDDSKEERDFIEHGPTSLGKIMAMIADMVHRRKLS
jgi:hypothetical protein